MKKNFALITTTFIFIFGSAVAQTTPEIDTLQVLTEAYFNGVSREHLPDHEVKDGAAAPTGQGDKMEIGYYGLNTAQWNQGVALFASGEVYAKLVKVTTSGYPDYVFTPEYKLPSLADMVTHIKAKGYLPGFKPAAQVEKEGMDLGEQNKMLVEKVEELTLHLIRMQKEIDELKK